MERESIRRHFLEHKQEGHRYRWPFHYSLSIFWQEWSAVVPIAHILTFSPGGPEALWSDLGGGMGTHRASGDVKAGTD